ncbi:uncharacterized protein EI90DRAFT_2424141 [Cantharellus anzutake]|uniref:uncharacterized protein n=1 Tax=Cantharellus anzutake TaxID=1750568 RepID=UPI00190765F5|nr:uncharacterized protein EI90DRAFT_2424141 [Cantharellus anzutake]KAF8338874.1 hypothetical protein EI90DRAFT_2424141 [Cantharellus anzutake]
MRWRKPTCGRCLRLGRPCEYAGTPKSRVKRLEEKIQNLESEIAALRSNPTPPIHDTGGTEIYANSRIPGWPFCLSLRWFGAL